MNSIENATDYPVIGDTGREGIEILKSKEIKIMKIIMKSLELSASGNSLIQYSSSNI